MEVLPLVADCCLPPLLPAAVTVVATTTATPVSITIIHHIRLTQANTLYGTNTYFGCARLRSDARRVQGQTI